jgi:cell division protein DivIC
MNAKRQKRRVSFGQKRRVRTHKRSMIAIVLVLMIITLTVSGMSLKAKEQQSIARETKLEEQIKQEKARTAQIEDMEKYADTDAYVEEIAREKLHLVHKNEIIFKAK